MPRRKKRAIAAVATLAFLTFYIWAVIGMGTRLPDHPLTHLLFYGIAGTAWGLPLLPLLSWAERKRERRPLPSRAPEAPGSSPTALDGFGGPKNQHNLQCPDDRDLPAPPMPAAEMEVEDADFIDVKTLIAAFSHDEHAARADRYFSRIHDPWGHVLRKPFSNLRESPPMLSGAAVVLSMVRPVTDHVVVDFGCGTGWLTQALGMMGCRPIGLDVSQSALDIARTAVAQHVYLKDRPIEFRLITEDGLPLDDSSVDRLICFDSFHHVADQAFYLREFFRVLKPGGVAGFHEPGANHSRSLDSQSEMRQFEVIENDIVIEDIEAMAASVGFEAMTIAAHRDVPVLFTRPAWSALLADPTDADLIELGQKVIDANRERSLFTLRKPGSELLDTRTLSAFGATVELAEASRDREAIHVDLLLRNTGAGTWLPSGPLPGSVNVGVKLFAMDGSGITQEPLRYELIDVPVAPGDAVTTRFSVAAHDVVAMEIDLVAELVTWLSMVTGRSTRIDLPPTPAGVGGPP